MRKFSITLVAIFSFIIIVGNLFACSCSREKDKSLYDISVSFSEEEKLLSGVMTFTFFNDTNLSLSELKFNLFANAYRENAKYSPISANAESSAFINGKSYGEMDITAVTKNGEKLQFSILGEDENILVVNLKEEVFPNESEIIDIYFSVKLANVLSRTGYNDNTINLANFYPTLCYLDDNGFRENVYYSYGDPFNSEVADYKVAITVSRNLTICCSGALIDSEIKEDKTTYFYELYSARDFAFVLSEKFEVATTTYRDIVVNYYYYKDAFPKDSLAVTINALKTFENLFGNYPYKTYSVCQTGFNEGGMEYPCLSMISDNLNDKKVHEEVIVHETAHQWWYSLVGNDEILHPFLDEGLTEYSVILFYENNKEYQVTRAELVGIAHKSYSTYCSIYDKIFKEKDTSMLRGLGEYTTEYEYVNIAYIKGALMFEHLRQAIGDELFFKGIKNYFEQNLYNTATPDSLIYAFNGIGSNASGFFKSWYNGEVIL